MSQRELLQRSLQSLTDFMNSAFPDEWDIVAKGRAEGLIEDIEAELEKLEAIASLESECKANEMLINEHNQQAAFMLGYQTAKDKYERKE